MPQRRDRYSWEDYLSWPIDERFELIDGVAYAMIPAPRRAHRRLVSEINRQIANALYDKPCEVYHLQEKTYHRIGVFSHDDRLTARAVSDVTVDLAAIFPRRS